LPKTIEVDQAISAAIVDDNLILVLVDGRELKVPIELILSVSRASADDKKNVKLIAQGIALCWPEIDEHLSVESLIAGRKIIDWQK
jgi:hypothetical protein